MASISSFFTAYSALRGGEPVEVIAIGVSAHPEETRHFFVVVDEHGTSSIARPDELNLYGVTEDARSAGEAAGEAGTVPHAE